MLVSLSRRVALVSVSVLMIGGLAQAEGWDIPASQGAAPVQAGVRAADARKGVSYEAVTGEGMQPMAPSGTSQPLFGTPRQDLLKPLAGE